MSKFFKFLLPLLFWAPLVQGSEYSQALCDTLSPLLQAGDIVFIDIDNAVFTRISRATGGWANHVGVIISEDSKGWTIAQSKLPVSQYENFCKFIGRSAHGLIAVRRHSRFWNPSDGDLIKKEALARMGKAYDLKFDFDSKKQYCSKLIYDIYQSAFGLEVGTVESLGDLMDGMKEQPTYKEDLAFWTVYYGGEIPRSQRIITPESQYRDPNLITIFDSSKTSEF